MDNIIFNSFIELYNLNQFYEAHEILELEWKKIDGFEKIYLQALIQITIANYKIFTNPNVKGAISLTRKSIHKLKILHDSNLLNDEANLYVQSLISSMENQFHILEYFNIDTIRLIPVKLLPMSDIFIAK